MKLIIAGGRKYKFTRPDIDLLDELHHNRQIEEVVTGGATGADQCGEEWARSRGIPVHEPLKPDWDDLTQPDAVIRYRRDGTPYDANAGPRRNRKLAEYADAVALFPGGRGTQSMYDEAKRAGIKIYDFRVGEITSVEPDTNPAPRAHKSLHDYQRQLEAKRKRK